MSMGLDVISGYATNDNFTVTESPQLIFVVLNFLSELIIPIIFLPFWNEIVDRFFTLYVQKFLWCDSDFEIFNIGRAHTATPQNNSSVALFTGTAAEFII